jgi:hypothetical protein|tara:strand:- start:1285 stop:1785 length:501 start_codon:yes stop_codon:yes gene_type:complete
MSQIQSGESTRDPESGALTLRNVVGKLRDQGVNNVPLMSVALLLKELYQNGEDSEGLLALRDAYRGGLEKVSDLRISNLRNPLLVADCQLFWTAQLANEYLGFVESASIMHVKYNPFEDGPVTDFYKATTGFDPIRELPFANKFFQGRINPNTFRRLREMGPEPTE